MDDTRHLASWIGGQEALHDRVYTLDEALEAVGRGGLVRRTSTRLAGELFHDEALRMAVVAPGPLPARPRPAPAAAPVTDAGRARTASPGPRPTVGPVLRAALALRLARAPPAAWARCALARAELESSAEPGTLDESALLDLAEVRWRTGDLAGAGEAAQAALARGRRRRRSRT